MANKKITRQVVLIVAVLLLALALGSRLAAGPNSFTLGRYTIGGGASPASGGDFELSATMGQHDAGATMAGDDFTVSGGFWSGEAETSGERFVYLPLIIKASD